MSGGFGFAVYAGRASVVILIISFRTEMVGLLGCGGVGVLHSAVWDAHRYQYSRQSILAPRDFLFHTVRVPVWSSSLTTLTIFLSVSAWCTKLNLVAYQASRSVYDRLGYLVRWSPSVSTCRWFRISYVVHSLLCLVQGPSLDTLVPILGGILSHRNNVIVYVLYVCVKTWMY